VTDFAQIDSQSFDSLPPAKLARLLDVEGGGAEAAAWTAADAAAALRQQLQAPLLPDLLAAPGAERERLEALVRSRPETATFAAQLTGREPTTELLESIKRWARHMREQPSSPLRGGPATVLYYAAIAAALVRTGRRITTLTDGQLRAGFEWALVQEGAEGLQGLLREAHAALE
jgi:hypothetical protein